MNACLEQSVQPCYLSRGLGKLFGPAVEQVVAPEAGGQGAAADQGEEGEAAADGPGLSLLVVLKEGSAQLLSQEVPFEFPSRQSVTTEVAKTDV